MGNMVLGPKFDRIASVRIHLLTSESTFGGASCICTALHSSKLAVEMFSCWLSQSLSWRMPWKAIRWIIAANNLLVFCSDSGKFCVRWLVLGQVIRKASFGRKLHCVCVTSFSAGPAQDQLRKRAWQRSKRVADSSLNSASYWRKARVEQTGRAKGWSLGRVPDSSSHHFINFWYIESSRYPPFCTNVVTPCYNIQGLFTKYLQNWLMMPPFPVHH